MAAGVWNDPELTARNFPDGWLRTGDLLYRDEKGYYFFAGRSDHMFKSGGVKVYAEEVEANLKTHPEVLDAAGGTGLPVWRTISLFVCSRGAR